ncbi:MAG TPA: serpin family protein [Gemmatimonadales bacterium]|nr:serpin family protein [Gemmatimonadales bacterium]
MQHPLLRRLALLSLLLLPACESPVGPPGGLPPLLTQLPRPLSTAELRVIDASNAFAFDLMREVTRRLPADSNAFLSPLSASMALGIALNGANGATFDSMQATLRLTGLTEPEINQGYKDLIALLLGLDSSTEMKIANLMWGHQGFALNQAFINAGKTFFDAEVATLDFASPTAVSTINDWVSGKTNGRIPTLLEEISPDEVLFLINAIYFKGMWRNAFEREDTRPGPFYTAAGTRTAQLMNQKDTLRYHETAEYQAVDLLYGNGAFAMTVLLPQPGHTPAELLSGMTADSWRELAGRFQVQDMHLTLPRFRLAYSRKLAEDLTALGMGIAFDRNRADFYRIADVRPDRLYITRVDQKTFVDVNEEGTEAAAATAVGVGVTSAPPSMVVDRPFVFAIRERLSGTVVFLGIMNVVGE